MENRFSRAVRAWSSDLITDFENPKAILRQNLHELRALVPRMNANLAIIKETMVLLEKELRQCRLVESELCEKIKFTIRQGRDDLAANYCLRLERLRQEIAITQAEYNTASEAYERAGDVKKAFLKEIDRKTREASQAVHESERSQGMARLADTLQSFDVNGLDATHRDMVSRLRNQSAHAEAQLDLATDQLNVDTYRLELEAEHIRAQAILDEFRAEVKPRVGGTPQAHSDPDSPLSSNSKVSS